MKSRKTLGSIVLAGTFIIGSVVIAGSPEKVNKNLELQGNNIFLEPEQSVESSKPTEETCPVDETNDFSSLSSCFLGKFFAGFSSSGKNLSAELSPPLSGSGEEVLRNMATGMAGLFAIGQKCISGVAENLSAIARLDTRKLSL